MLLSEEDRASSDHISDRSLCKDSETRSTSPKMPDLEKEPVEKSAYPNGSNSRPIHDNVVDFDGPADPERPMNWPSSKKIMTIAVVSAMTLLSPMCSTISSASTPFIMDHFQSANAELGSLITTIFLLGYVFGPMLIAPLSELYGRAILYKVCMVLFCIFNIACAVSDSLASLIVYRFFAGAMASCPVTIGTGSIADMIATEKRAGAMSAYVLGAVLGPSIGPLAGGYLAPAAGWRWTFWLMAIATGIMALVCIVLIQESYAYVLLDRKTRRLRKSTGNTKLRSALASDKTPRQYFTFSIVRPLRMLLSPIIFLLSIYASITYGYLYLCFTTFESVFRGQYGFSSGQSGLALLSLGIGAMIGVVLNTIMQKHITKYLTAQHGPPQKPEWKLPPLVIGGLCTSIALFWYGWSAQAKTHWIVPILGVGLLGIGQLMAFMSSITYLVDAFPVYAASVTATTTITRSLFGAVLPLAGPAMYAKLGLGWGNSLLGFISFAFMPVTVAFYIYGERIRNTKRFKIEL